MIIVPPLPYSEDAFEPLLSARSVRLHRDKQERYVRRTNDLVRGTMFEGVPLPVVVDECARALDEDARPSAWLVDLFEQSSQALNHAQMWASMSPPARDAHGRILPTVYPAGIADLQERWRRAAASVFASGWVWLVARDGDLVVEATADADRPRHGRPLLVMDVWEHAYYLDYPDAKATYVDVWCTELAAWGTLLQEGIL